MAKSKHFMVVLCEDFSQRLKIPRNFLKHIEEALSKQEKSPKPIKLADTTGKTWCVSIERDAHGTHFKSGWPKFAREHRLQENEFLIFQYDGNQQFSVVILDDTLCEREICEEVKKEAPEVVLLSDSEGSESSESVTFESSESNEANSEEDEENEEDDSEDNGSDSSFMNKPRDRNASSSGPSSSKKMGGQYVSRRRAVTDMEKQKAAEAAFSFSSKNPNFMLRISARMAYRWCSLRFPMDFSKEYLPCKKTKFLLWNSAGQKWIGSYNTEKRTGKGLISGGWTKFARYNCLEEDDYCVFELVNKTEFVVHIFRVVEKVVPPVWVK